MIQNYKDREEKQITTENLLSAVDTAVQKKVEEIREEVEKIKDLVGKRYGTPKYDSCYDDILNLKSLQTKE